MSKEDPVHSQAHLAITSGHGFRITFDNGWALSVQFGTGNYCSRRDFDAIAAAERKERYWDSKDAEIAVIDPEGEFVRLTDDFVSDDVAGWVTPERILHVMNKVAAQ